jgi:CheY-like chemotaxis protein
MESLRHSHGCAARITVLVVDDDDSLRDSLCRHLRSGGYEVLAATGGAEALETCLGSIHPIELLVTDYNMPDVTGVQLARECTRLNSQLSVLYISGARPDEELRADLENPKRGFLAKPFRKEELLFKANELLITEPAAPREGARWSKQL